MSEMTALRSRRFLLGADFLITAFLLLLTIIIFRNAELDITIQKLFWQSGSGWYLKDLPFFSLLYHFGNLPALILTISGLVMFGISYRAMKWAKWRKIGLFLVLTMLLGPGLIVNAVLKDHWGRPRPRNITEFGGKYNYEKVLSIDPESPGKSFPCGHASMGFYLFVPWFLLRKRHKVWAAVSLASGIIMGLAIGLARIAQGGHFASDVIVSGLLVYLITTILYDIMRFRRTLWYYPKTGEIDSRQRSLVSLVVLFLIIFALLSVSVATPYSKSGTYTSEEYLLHKYKTTVLKLDLYAADVKLRQSDSLQIGSDVQGFGFPRSKLDTRFAEQLDLDSLSISFTQKKKGMFTELDNGIDILYPFPDNSIIKLSLKKGTAVLALPDSLNSLTLIVVIEKGSLEIDLPPDFKPRIKLRGNFKLEDKTGFNDSDSVFINENFRLDLIVREGSIILR
jgi:lipid A 4'-phosphatase